ncbi:MAG: 3-oxo-5-alpha-steroid 4-dehydrogenase, partial [Myxococcota bacterium]
MTEALLYDRLTILLFALAGLTFAALLFVSAPYGRHERRGWGPTVPAKLGWVAMESPSGVGFALVFAFSGGFSAGLVPVLLFALWQAHYTHRTFVFPLRMRGGRPMPLLVMLLAIAFNCLNAYLNARWIGHFGQYSVAWLTDPRFVVGVGLFVMGFAVNLHSDSVLRRLRRPGETGYRVPNDGLHRYVSA